MRKIAFLLIAVLTTSCVPPADDERDDLAIAWVGDSAEYEAIARQVYRVATEALPGMIEDTSWSALPSQQDAADLPPAVIMDIDETTLTNARFQFEFERPFADSKLNAWSAANVARAVPGAVEFVTLARASGVEVFFVTNRPCEAREGGTDPCPQKPVVIQDLVEAGLPATADNVSLSYEREGWRKEKAVRRDWIAERYRVIMLIGDDLGDFIPCTRKRPSGPCAEGATAGSRAALTEQYADYWGTGWYILPNPMHGSWTNFR